MTQPISRITLATVLSLSLAACLIGTGEHIEPDTDPGTGSDAAPDPGVPGARRMVAYYAAWDVYARMYEVAEMPADQLTVINYAFMNISEAGECILGDPYADVEKAYPGDSQDPGAVRGNFHQLQLLKAKHPHLAVLLSVGGWTWSDRFSDLAATAAGRERFAKSCVTLIDKYGFDGLDIDWEFPGGGGLAPGRPEDTQNFTLLLAALRAELGTRLLTIAASASPKLIANVEVAKIAPLLDWVNVMTYDFHGSFEARTNFAAPLAHVATDTSPDAAQLNVEAAIETWIAGGLAADKLVLGMPLYGHGWSGVAASNNGLFQPSTSVPMGTWAPGSFDYRDIAANYLPTMTRHWSPDAKAPWLYDANRGLMISYEDAESLVAKTLYLRSMGLGGAMFWELSSDDAQHTLVRTVHVELMK